MSNKTVITPPVNSAPPQSPLPIVTAPLGASITGISYCPYRRATDLLQRLAPGKMRIGFFIGAGCPLSIRVTDGSGTKPLIPDIVGLTANVKSTLDADPNLKVILDKIWDRIISRSITSPTVEDALSHIRGLKSLCGSLGIDGFSEKELGHLDQEICKRIRSIASVSLPSNNTAYHVLARWIQTVPRERPVEVFTTNYDLLMEQAFEEQHVPHFDGFVGSESAFLDHDSMVEDDLPPRWARLWKIHGSINWWMTSDRRIRRRRDSKDGEQLLIYPSHLKYDQSRQMPFLAMLDRLRVFLSSDQCVLVMCGYSFGDPHINAFIAQGLASNPNAACIAMIFGDLADVNPAVQLANQHPNLSLLAADGAILGTVLGEWHNESKNGNPMFPLAVATGSLGSRSKAPEDRCKWLLGDFGALGRFLSNQLSRRDIEEGASSAF